MASGERAEALVAQWLERRGMTIEVRNWRTAWCEIDIVASQHIATGQPCLWLIEVKYRQNAHHGDGLEAVDRHKQRRLQRAASVWHRQVESDCRVRVAAVAVIGRPPRIAAVREIYFDG